MAVSSTKIRRTITIKIKDAFNSIREIEWEELNEIVDILDYDDDDYHPDNVCSKVIDHITEYISKFHFHQIAFSIMALLYLISNASSSQPTVCYEDGNGNEICHRISEEVLAFMICVVFVVLLIIANVAVRGMKWRNSEKNNNKEDPQVMHEISKIVNEIIPITCNSPQVTAIKYDLFPNIKQTLQPQIQRNIFEPSPFIQLPANYEMYDGEPPYKALKYAPQQRQQGETITDSILNLGHIHIDEKNDEIKEIQRLNKELKVINRNYNELKIKYDELFTSNNELQQQYQELKAMYNTLQLKQQKETRNDRITTWPATPPLLNNAFCQTDKQIMHQPTVQQSSVEQQSSLQTCFLPPLISHSKNMKQEQEEEKFVLPSLPQKEAIDEWQLMQRISTQQSSISTPPLPPPPLPPGPPSTATKLNVSASPFIPSHHHLDTIHEVQEHEQQQPQQSQQQQQQERKKINNNKINNKKHYKNHKINDNKANYGPLRKYSGEGNIQIIKKFNESIKPSLIEEELYNLYCYMNKSFAIKENIKKYKYKNNGEIAIINYDLHSTKNNKNELIYCVIEKINKKQKELHRNYEWKMIDTFCNSEIIYNKYNILQNELPNSYRSSIQFISQINKKENILKILLNKNIIINIINKVKWCKINIFEKKNNEMRMTLSIIKKKWILKLNEFTMNDEYNNNQPILIPILMFNERNEKWIEFIWRIKINNNDIGISIKYDDNNNTLKIKGIHLDLQCIKKQHELINAKHMKHCNCFNEWKSNINSLSIGNTDCWKNKLKDMYRKYDDINKEKIKLQNQIQQLTQLRKI